MIGEKTAHALKIIRDNQIVQPGQFARLCWPEARGWTTHVNTGYGVSHGRQMLMAGGAWLGRLRKAGLIEGLCDRDSPVRLSPLGERELEAFDLQRQ